MKLLRHVLAVLSFVLPAATVAAQPIFVPATFHFGIDGTSTSGSGAGGSSAAPGNATAIFSARSLLSVFPDPFGPYFAYEGADLGTWAAYFGDTDSDGNYAEGNFDHVDALWLPFQAPNPPNVFDFYLSFSNDLPGAGALPAGIDKADVVRLLPRGGFVPFIIRAQLANAMGLIVPIEIATLDVDGFAVDESSGDVYWSLALPSSVNGMPVQGGGVIRLLGSAYVSNPDGTVATVTPGGAEIVLHESEVLSFMANAGVPTPASLADFEIEPGGGTFVSASTAKTLRHLDLASQSAVGVPIVVSTRSSGSVLDINGIMFNTAAALGLSPTSFTGGTVGPIVALAIRDLALQDSPRMLDMLSVGVNSALPTTLTLDIGGASPNDFVVLAGVIGQGSVAGSRTNRHSIFQPEEPIHLVLTGFGRFYEFYPFNAADGLFQLTVAEPFVATDGFGYARRTYSVPSLPPGLAFAFQYLDIANLALSTPSIPVTQ